MLSVKRLKKEYLTLQNEPVPLAVAKPIESNILEWRFLIKGSDDYEGGYYHGKLIFPPQYPMKPPGIMFFTPSGRFEINKRVCLTISDFHPETWSPLWTVGSILTGIVSFMNSDEITTGGLAASSKHRKAFAASSAAYNARDQVYSELFGTASPSEIFEEADRKIAENVSKRMELRDNPQKYSEASRMSEIKPAALGSIPNANSAANSGGRVAFTNNSVKSNSASESIAAQAVAVGEAETKSVGLTKSAKKRLKEKERTLRAKELGPGAEFSKIESFTSADNSDDEYDDKLLGEEEDCAVAENHTNGKFSSEENMKSFTAMKISGDT